MITTKKFLGKAFSLVCAIALVLSTAFVYTAYAVPGKNGQEYPGTAYTATIYGGNHGTVNGQASVTGSGANYLSGLTVQVDDDSKYYAKSIRLAGYDNDAAAQTYASIADDGTVVPINVPALTEDMDFVVTYGITADRVAYTVNYQDANGNQLAEPQTFHGDIGDQAVVAAAYIEGYVPEVTGYDMPLQSDPSQNVFTFVYNRLPEGFTQVVNPDGTVDIIAPDGSIVEGAYTTNLDAEGDVPEGDVLVTDEGTVVVDEDGNPLSAPGEVTLDDNGNPLASQSSSDVEAIPWWPFLIGAIALVVVILAIVAKSKKKSEATDLH